MDTISHSETSLLGKLYMHQENNASFMTKNEDFAFFYGNFWDTLKKTLTYRFVHNNFKFVRNPSYNS